MPEGVIRKIKNTRLPAFRVTDGPDLPRMEGITQEVRLVVLFFFLCLFIIFEREREMKAGEGQRERETENLKQASR